MVLCARENDDKPVAKGKLKSQRPINMRAFGFAYASLENHCEQPLVSLNEPPSSAKDE